MKEVNSIEEFVAGGESQLKTLADAGNAIAAEWLATIQAAPIAVMKLSLFGDLKIALMRDTRPEARAVANVLFPQGVQ